MEENTELPAGWESDKPQEFRKTFPDGTDVILSIVSAGEEFEVWCSAEHRVSGPSDAMISQTRSLEEAVAAAHKDMHEWNEELE